MVYGWLRQAFGNLERAGPRLSEEALKSGLIPQWWTLSSNVASLRIGQSLGYALYAIEEGVRLATPIERAR